MFHTKMLVALDGSSFAEAALPVAAELASSGHVPVVLGIVVKLSEHHGTALKPAVPPEGRVDLVQPEPASTPVLAETRPQAELRARGEAQEYLGRVAHQWFPRGSPSVAANSGSEVSTVVLTGEKVAEELSDYAKENSITFIVLATHGRTGFAKMLLGSVADELVRSGRVPILLVRPEQLS